MNVKKICFLMLSALQFSACNTSKKEEKVSTDVKKDSVVVEEPTASVNTFKGKNVPVLCYHAIREIEPGDSAEQKTYSVSPANFEAQIKALADNGYTTITPDQLNGYLVKGTQLPEKPVMITFDDGRKEQYTIGGNVLEKNKFRGVFFIMTVALGKKRYMSRDDVKALADNGHIIGCHTWDHQKVTKLKGDEFQLQLVKPKNQLEKITGKPVTSFAYPYGLWNDVAADSLKSFGYSTAFTFFGKQSPERPLYTIERIAATNSMKNFIEKIEKATH